MRTKFFFCCFFFLHHKGTPGFIWRNVGKYALDACWFMVKCTGGEILICIVKSLRKKFYSWAALQIELPSNQNS